MELPIPFHPLIVHFPIALFVTALAFEAASLLFKRKSFHQTAVQIYIFAALITPFVVRTGMVEAHKLNLHHPTLDNHRHFALWTMWGALASLPTLWYLKQRALKQFRIIFIIFLIGVVSWVTLCGREGGEMVYEYAVGVEI